MAMRTFEGKDAALFTALHVETLDSNETSRGRSHFEVSLQVLAWEESDTQS